MDDILKKKYDNIINYLKSLNSAVVAYSAGVDSTLLLYLAKLALDKKDKKDKNVLALSARSAQIPKREIEEAQIFCKKNNIRHIVFDFSIEKFANNPKERCYICKYEIFSKIIEIAKLNNISNILEGSNISDNTDYRPGRRALSELNILSPFCIYNFTKEDIRNLSKELNLYTYNKPSFACLASRIPYGDIITEKKLNMIDSAEEILAKLGFKQFRVRLHKDIARIEINEEDFEKIIQKEIKDEITSKFKDLGFNYTALDLLGYRSGSLNEVLENLGN